MTDLGDFDEQVVHSGGGAVVGLSTPGKAGSSTRSGAACTVCGSRTFENTAYGTWVCIDCGTASQDVRLATQDIDEGRDLTAMRRTKRKRNDLDPVVTLPTAHSAQMNFVKAWMHIITLQTRFLSGYLPRSAAAAYSSSVRLLVRRYLRWWAAGDRPGVGAASPPAARHAYPLFLVVNGSLALPPSSAYCSLLPQGVPPPWAPPISLSLTLAVAAAAARLSGVPLTSTHLLQAAVGGHMPYMAAWGSVPAELRQNMTFALSFFTPAVAPRPPSIAQVERNTALLAASVGVPLPPLNSGAILSQWLHGCGLHTPELYLRSQALLRRLPECLPVAKAAMGNSRQQHMHESGTGGVLPFPAHLASPEERTDSAVFLGALFLLVLLSHRDGHRIGAAMRRAADATVGPSMGALGGGASSVPYEAAAAFRSAWLPLGSCAALGVRPPMRGSGDAGGGSSGTASRNLPPRHEAMPSQEGHAAGDAAIDLVLAAGVSLHGGAAVPALARTGQAKARTSNAEKAAFTKWRLYAMEACMFETFPQEGDEGGGSDTDVASTAFSQSTQGGVGSTVGGMSTVTGAASVRMVRGSSANKRSGTVQNTLAKRGPSVPQRLLGDLSAAAASLRAAAAEDGTPVPGSTTWGPVVALRGFAAACSELGLGSGATWRSPFRCGVLFGCVPFDVKRDAQVLLKSLTEEESAIVHSVACSLPCSVLQLAHSLVCIMHWLAGGMGTQAP